MISLPQPVYNVSNIQNSFHIVQAVLTEHEGKQTIFVVLATFSDFGANGKSFEVFDVHDKVVLIASMD